MLSPTRDLARVLVDLAMGDGKEVVAGGVQVEGEGRTVRNSDMRKLAGLDKSRVDTPEL